LPTDLSATEVEGEARSVEDQARLMIDLIHTRVSRILEAIVANADAARLVVRLTRGNDRLVDDTLRRIDDHIVGILTRDIETAKDRGWGRPGRSGSRVPWGGARRRSKGTRPPGGPRRRSTAMSSQARWRLSCSSVWPNAMRPPSRKRSHPEAASSS